MTGSGDAMICRLSISTAGSERSLSSRLGERDAAEPVGAVKCSFRATALDQRPPGTSCHRNRSGAGRIQHLAGVDHHLLNAGVARHTADAEHVDIGVADGVQQG